MELNSKFKQADKIWFMDNNKPIEKVVTGVVFFTGFAQDSAGKTEYPPEGAVGYFTEGSGQAAIGEQFIFASKAELLASL